MFPADMVGDKAGMLMIVCGGKAIKFSHVRIGCSKIESRVRVRGVNKHGEKGKKNKVKNYNGSMTYTWRHRSEKGRTRQAVGA